MKKLILGATILMVSLAGPLSARADHSNGINGLIFGAGGGAIAGQAIGRNTEATLIGTAVGSLLGYVIGNEIDKGGGYHRQVGYHSPQPVIHRQQRVVKHYPPQRVVYKNKYVTENHHYYPIVEERYTREPRCREAEILGTVNGRAKKIYGTVCRTEHGWELVSDPSGQVNMRGDRGRHRGGQHWVGGRRF